MSANRYSERGEVRVVSSKAAFDALKTASWELAQQYKSDHLSTLWAEMDGLNGEPIDPAIADEWAEAWGSQQSLSLVDAFKATVSFFRVERGWSKEEGVRIVLSGAELSLNKNEPSGRLWELWHSALVALNDT